jgi:8-hydroxy-5-deazaflavin:NADPH oxidoreductase
VKPSVTGGDGSVPSNHASCSLLTAARVRTAEIVPTSYRESVFSARSKWNVRAAVPVKLLQVQVPRPGFNSATEVVDREVLPTLGLPRLAVLGAGHVGPVIARIAIAAGFRVSLAASGDPDEIALMTQVLVPGAEARWAAHAIADSDIVVLSIPLHKFADFDPGLVADKLVVDAMNYWPPVNGLQEMFEDRRYSSSEIVQRRLIRSTVIKTLNHIGYHEMEDGRRRAGSPERRALGVAGDDPHAVDVVAEVIERIGYDTVRLDSLRAGGLLEPGSPVFGVSLHRTEFEASLRAKVA